MINLGGETIARLFISYTGADSFWTNEFYRDLKRALGYRARIYFAEQMNLPGEEFGPLLWNSLRESEFFLVIVTPEATRSQWVRDEVTAALKLNTSSSLQPHRPIIISILNGSINDTEKIDPALLRFHFADFRNPYERENTIRRIAETIHHPDRLGNDREILQEPLWRKALRRANDFIIGE